MVQKRAHNHGSELTESEMHEQTLDPYDESAKYAEGVVIFVCVGIALYGALRGLLAARARNGTIFKSSSTYRKTVAAARYLSSRQQKLHGWYYPTLGIGLLIIAFYAFTMIWTWSIRPYYMSHWYVSSPPLAIRTGMMALGCFPFIFAFATKWNFITFITGHSHEKLQVFHQFMSHIFLVLSFIHTIPFLIQGLAEYRPGTEPPITQLDYSWNVAKKVYYWTGAGLIAMLGWLCWFSIPWLRHRYYETFKYLHVLCALLFIPFFVLHCNRLLGSWPYIFATCAIYGASVVFRFGWMFWINFSRGVPRATFEVLPAGMIKLRVTLGTKERWSPGQHYFFHFLTVQPFQSHPFTIASNSHNDSSKPQEMVVLVRQASGVTKSLGRYLKTQHEIKKIPLFLDGPFGGTHTDLGIFEHVVLFAGGTGITFIAPLLQDLVRKITSAGEKTVCKSVHLIWSVREPDALGWFLPEIEATVSEAAGAVSVSLHVTGAMRESKRSGDAASSEVGQEKGSESGGDAGTIDPAQSRPAIPSVLLNASREYATLGVAVCGPESLVFDVRNSVASIQKQILLGTTSCVEVFLHSEEYSW